ncbi:hypothetical protein PLUTE_b6005 [Pseudoalteromonas luteoviolacea DSM 6061]|nr:hypothetical protein [Pseudoalteromonas luteoviolacea DSM 6061]
MKYLDISYFAKTVLKATYQFLNVALSTVFAHF